MLVLAALVGVGFELGRDGGGSEDAGSPPPRAGQDRQPARAAPRDALFLGERVRDLRLEEVGRDGATPFFEYGTCEPEGGEGCEPPLVVRNEPICTEHPLEIDARPSSMTRRRGVPVLRYAADQIVVLTGRRAVSVVGEPRFVRESVRAVAALRPWRGPARLGRSLPAPRIPRWALRELVLIRRVVGRVGVRRARSRLGISQSAIRSRLALVRVLGRHAPTGVPPARVTPREVIRDREALTLVKEGAYPPDRSKAELRRRAARHRARLRTC